MHRKGMVTFTFARVVQSMGVPAPIQLTRISSILLALVVSVSATAREPFECPSLKPSGMWRPAYQRLHGEPRCEGFFEKPVSASSFLELVSLTVGEMTIITPDKVSSAGESRVALSAEADSPGVLTVQPIPAGILYRMDARVESGTLLWDSKPMLDATRTVATDLGVLLRLESAKGHLPLYAPVQVSAITQVSPITKGVIANSKLRLVVRTSTRITNLRWRSYVPGTGSPPPEWAPAQARKLEAWDSSVIWLPSNLIGRRSVVEVVADGTSSAESPAMSFVIR